MRPYLPDSRAVAGDMRFFLGTQNPSSTLGSCGKASALRWGADANLPAGELRGYRAMNVVVIGKLAGTQHAFRLSRRATLHLDFADELGIRFIPDGKPTKGVTRQVNVILDALGALLRGDERARAQPRLSGRRTGRLHFHRARQ